MLMGCWNQCGFHRPSPLAQRQAAAGPQGIKGQQQQHGAVTRPDMGERADEDGGK